MQGRLSRISVDRSGMPLLKRATRRKVADRGVHGEVWAALREVTARRRQ
jgi:hypothetical protein